MKLIENVLRFDRHLANAKELEKKDISDYLIYNTLAMECFQATNAIIEIGEYIVAEKKLGFPSTYREVFELIEQDKMISKELLNTIKRLIFLRNLIAHEYYRIKEEELLEMVKLLNIAKDLVQITRRLIC